MILVEILVGAFLLLSLGFCLHAMWVLIFRPDEW